MLHIIRYNYRIYPNDAQASFFNRTIGHSRFVYNHFLNVRSAAYKENGESLSYNKCAAMLTELKRNEDHSWLKEADYMALQESLRDLDNAFQAFFTHNARYPRFHKKGKCAMSYRTRNQNHGVRIEDNHIVLPKIGSVKAKISRLPEGRILNATVMHKASDKWFVSLCVEEEYDVHPNEGGYIGIDVGIKAFYTDSNGNDEPNLKFLYKEDKHLRREQRKLSRMIEANVDHYIIKDRKRYPVYKKPFSECKNIQKQRRKIARIHENIANKRMDHMYKTARALCHENQVIGHEDLNIAGMMKNHKLARSIGDVSWSMFFRILEYEATKFGTRIVKIPRFYASSQTCSCCEYKNPAVKDLSVRKWICPQCGTEHGRDVNAAVNIRNEALRIAGIC